MLALLALLAAVSPEPLPAPSASWPPSRAVRVVEVRLSSLETTLRTDVPPGRFRDLARTLVERARVRLAAGDPAAADQLGAAASDTLRAEQPFVLILRVPYGAQPPQMPQLPAGTAFPRLPAGAVMPRPPSGMPEDVEFDAPPAPRDARAKAASAADRAARRLDHVATMLVMTAGFAERGDAAKLLGLARGAFADARKALAANDARSADGGARRAETLARAALHAAIADDPALKLLPPLPPLPRRPPLPVPAPVPPGELP